MFHPFVQPFFDPFQNRPYVRLVAITLFSPNYEAFLEVTFEFREMLRKAYSLFDLLHEQVNLAQHNDRPEQFSRTINSRLVEESNRLAE